MDDRLDTLNTDFSSYLDSIDAKTFEQIALEVFHNQYQHNSLYRTFINQIGIAPNSVGSVDEIPFLPIELFKSHEIKTGNWKETGVFLSSGTTGDTTSRHYVRNIQNYLISAAKSFEKCYGPLSDYVFLALLPSYLEREGSSLIAMMNFFIDQSKSEFSGFYLNEYENLLNSYKKANSRGLKVIIWGVSFALLDLAESNSIPLKDAIIVETGGMKGRRKEILREDLHTILKRDLHCPAIHSEYGMTELFSQAYSIKDGLFKTPPWMKVLIRDISDPLTITGDNLTGCLNIIDLANVDTCAFIATNDLGKTTENGSFEITGRLDNSDIRGCNLMIN